MVKADPKTPEEVEEGAVQVAATAITRRRAPRKKASPLSDGASPKISGHVEEGPVQMTATAVTRKRAPRKKASQSSEEAAPGPATTPTPKRKRNTSISTGSRPTTGTPAKKSRATPKSTPRATPKQTTLSSPASERRPKPYLEEPPEAFIVKMERLSMQKLFILGHKVTGMNGNLSPEISFDIVGSTGNMYTTIIRKVPTCNCPDARFRRVQCKHIFYALAHALKVPENLQYQNSFLSAELREIWEASPLHRVELISTENEDGRRKPIEGDCPICFMEFEPNEQIVWCEAACGNNIHKACFEQWALSGNQDPVRCVYCRTPWKTGDNTQEVDRIRQKGFVGPLGYVNVAHQFGLAPPPPRRGPRPPRVYSNGSPS